MNRSVCLVLLAAAIAYALVAFSGAAVAQSACGTERTRSLDPGIGATEEVDFQIRSNGEDIAATLTRTGRSRARDVVLMLHGYTGSRDEFPVAGSGQRLFELTADRLAQSGIPSLRVDFRGSGDSSGRWRDTTFRGQVQDVFAAIATLRRDRAFRRSRVVLLGFSQGGLVALNAVGLGADVASVVLWNPVLDPRHTYAGILGEEAIRSGVQLTFDGREREVVGNSGLNAEFFRQIVETNPIADASAFDGPVLVVTGARDSTVASGPGLAQVMKDARGRRETRIVVLDADHGFNAASGPAEVETAIACTVDFITGR